MPLQEQLSRWSSFQRSSVPGFSHSVNLEFQTSPDSGVFVVEHVLCGDDRNDPGGAQILHHGVQRQVAVLAQELVRVACKIGELFISHYSLS